MTYKDMTFCEFYDRCKDGPTCHRRLTPEVREKAESLGLWICAFVQAPQCYKENKG